MKNKQHNTRKGDSMHEKSHKFAGKTVKLKEDIQHPQFGNIGGKEVQIEDYWDKVYGMSWKVSDGNPAAMIYGIRTGTSDKVIPMDDEVVYGKLNGLGLLINEVEIEGEV